MKSVPRYIDLQEGATRNLPTNDLTRAEVEALASSTKFRLARSLSGLEYELSCINWVGQVPVGRDLTIRVAPKVPIANLFWMLDLAYSFKNLETWEDRIEKVAFELCRDPAVSSRSDSTSDMTPSGISTFTT